MVVRTLNNGRAVTGLYIGPRNARRHFPRTAKSVELQMGHLHIHCELEPDFWQGRPEICDARLSGWLESSIFHRRPRRAPVPVAMIPVGKNVFRLHPFPLPSVAGNGLTRAWGRCRLRSARMKAEGRPERLPAGRGGSLVRVERRALS